MSSVFTLFFLHVVVELDSYADSGCVDPIIVNFVYIHSTKSKDDVAYCSDTDALSS